ATVCVEDVAELVDPVPLLARWKHLRTSNVIESPFATVRLRQRVTKGAGSRTKGLLMAYKLLDWRRPGGGGSTARICSRSCAPAWCPGTGFVRRPRAVRREPAPRSAARRLERGEAIRGATSLGNKCSNRVA